MGISRTPQIIHLLGHSVLKCRVRSGTMLLNQLHQSTRVRSHYLIHLLPIPENHESRHSSNAEFLGKVWEFIHVKLDKFKVRVLLR